jgi:hypothetical protein
MNWEQVLNILGIVLVCVLGYMVSYFKTNATFKEKIAALINYAESQYLEGKEKKDYVVDEIYKVVPVWLKPIVNKTMLGLIVQSVFDSIEEYANKQLDKIVDVIPDPPAEEK